MNDYEAATAFLDARIGLGVKPGLERMVGLMDAMADPHLAAPIIHVGGTNGKTSTVRYIAAVLTRQGLAPGTFISPHLESIEQRFGIGAEHLTRNEFADLVAEVGPVIELFEEQSGSGVTYFEATAALAFSLFAGYPASVGVVEVGLGGRLDATNVVEPQVVVITTLGRDHMEYLGSEIAGIAAEKAAIIKEGCVVVTGALHDEAEAVIAARAAEVGAQRFRLGTDFSITGNSPAVGGWVIDVDGIYSSHNELQLRTHGRHQVDNFAIAVAAVEAFSGRALDELAVAEAATIATPGRMEIVDTSPLLMIDGAHNLPAAEALAASLQREFPSTEWSLVFGAMVDKEADEMLAVLAPQVDSLFAVAAEAPRAMPVAELVEMAERLNLRASGHPSVAAGLRAAVAAAGPNGAVLVAGSLYVAGEARVSLAPDR